MNIEPEVHVLLMELRTLGFKHIAEVLQLIWGDRDCDAYLNKLGLDSRDGTRQGFPPEVFQIILKLHLLHHEKFPKPVTDIWNTK